MRPSPHIYKTQVLTAVPGNQRTFRRSWSHPALSVAHLLLAWFQPSPVRAKVLQTDWLLDLGSLPFREFILGASGLVGDLVGTMPSTYDVLGQLRASESNSKPKVSWACVHFVAQRSSNTASLHTTLQEFVSMSQELQQAEAGSELPPPHRGSAGPPWVPASKKLVSFSRPGPTLRSRCVLRGCSRNPPPTPNLP